MGPPKGVAPERLFRLLSQRPRPRLAVPSPAWLEATIHVVAPTADEIGNLIEESQSKPAPEQQCARECGLLALVLRVDGEAPTPSDVASMPAHRASELYALTLKALATVAPAYEACTAVTANEWHAALCEGAKHRSNTATLMAMSGAYEAVELGKKIRLVPKPERYFGTLHLTDGQWMAFRAARTVFESQNQ